MPKKYVGPTGSGATDIVVKSEIAKAGLTTVGLAQAVFIAKGGTVPGGLPAYTIVIEAGA